MTMPKIRTYRLPRFVRPWSAQFYAGTFRHVVTAWTERGAHRKAERRWTRLTGGSR